MNIERGKRNKALKVVLYGPEGVGKSTFAAQFPGVIFIDTEGSTDHMDVARTPRPQSFTEILLDVDYFIGHPDELRTLAIDTADWAEKLATEQMCAEKQLSGVEDMGYGKGYTYVAESFGKLLNKLETLREKGVNIVLTAHAQMRKFEQPDEMGAYDRWELKLSRRTAALTKEWADLLLFANYKTYVVATSNDGKKAKATGGTKRVMYTQHTATHDAKNRAGLAAELPFEFAQIAHLFPVFPERAPETAPAAQKPPAQAAADSPRANPPAQAASGEKAVLPPTTRKAEPARPQGEQADKPAQKPASTAAPREEKPQGVPDALAALMKAHDVQVAELQAVVSQRGYYPVNTPVANYDPKFVRGVLIGAWPQVEAMILKNREDVPF